MCVCSLYFHFIFKIDGQTDATRRPKVEAAPDKCAVPWATHPSAHDHPTLAADAVKESPIPADIAATKSNSIAMHYDALLVPVRYLLDLNPGLINLML